MNRSEEYIKAQLVECAWKFGSHYGGAEACLLILHTLKNRQKAGFGSYLQILDSVDKFQAAPPKTTSHPSIWDRNFLRLLNEIDSICDDTRKDASNGALYWGDLTDVQSQWFLEKVCRNPERQRCAEMSSLAFFK